MMYTLLKLLSVLPLTPSSCEAFLYRTAMMAATRVITIDDWIYLARLIMYRTCKMLSANDNANKELVEVFKKIEREKQDLTGESDHHLN